VLSNRIFVRRMHLLFALMTTINSDKTALTYYAPTVGKGAISVAFVRRSVRLSVYPSVTYIANNSRTQRPSVPKFGMKVPHLRRDSHIVSRGR